MDDTATTMTAETEPGEATAAELLPTDEVVDEELLVEEVSIDGMCGVY